MKTRNLIGDGAQSPIGSHHRARAILALRALGWSQFLTADAVGGRNTTIPKVENWFRGLDAQEAHTYVSEEKISQAWKALRLDEVTEQAPPRVAQIMDHYGIAEPAVGVESAGGIGC